MIAFYQDEARPMEDRAAIRSGVPPDHIRTVTGTNFQAAVLEAEGPIAVEFMSYGCVHCGVMEPVLQQVAAELEGSEAVMRVDIGLEPELAACYEIAGTPTLVMFLDGQEVGRVAGPSPIAENLLEAVTQPFAVGR